MSNKGTIRFKSGLVATLNGDTWSCKNPFWQLLLNLTCSSGSRDDQSKYKPPVSRVRRAARLFGAEIIQLPLTDDEEFPGSEF
jgi:hypothetical protein